MRPRAPRKCSPRCSRTRRNRSEEHTSELQSPCNLVCRLLLEKKKNIHSSFNSRERSSLTTIVHARIPLFTIKPQISAPRLLIIYSRYNHPAPLTYLQTASAL